jgi:hypothetical protein
MSEQVCQISNLLFVSATIVVVIIIAAQQKLGTRSIFVGCRQFKLDDNISCFERR